MTRFLIDASLPKPTANVICARGYTSTDVRDIGLGTAKDSEIAAHAKTHKLAIMTADLDFGNVIDYPPADYAGIVVIRPPEDANKAVVLALVNDFLQATDVMANLVGRLPIVEPGRIRLRPPL